MATMFRLDPDRLDALAADLRAVYAGEFADAQVGLYRVAQALPEIWSGETQRHFNALYAGWADRLAVLGHDLILIEVYLHACASEYRRLNAERQRATQTALGLRATEVVNGTVASGASNLAFPTPPAGPPDRDPFRENREAQECPAGAGLVACFQRRGLLEIADGTVIDPAEFSALQAAVYADIRGRRVDTLGLNDYVDLRTGYDTPFWNGFFEADVTVIVNGQPYRQSEVNYFAQGMLAAARGSSLAQAYLEVAAWKSFYYGEVPPSPGALYWTAQGYYEYLRLSGDVPDLPELAPFPMPAP